MTDVPARADPLVFIDYAEFGRRFFAAAVTRTRVADAAQRLAGRPIEVGPMGVGPLGLIKVRAQGAVGRPTVEPRDADEVSFELTIPVDLQMRVDIGLDKYRFNAVVKVRLALTARAAEALLIVVDIEPPTKRNVDVEVRAEGLRASVLQIVAGVDGEVRKAVAKFVRREIAKPAIQSSTRIDVGAALLRMDGPVDGSGPISARA